MFILVALCQIFVYLRDLSYSIISLDLVWNLVQIKLLLRLMDRVHKICRLTFTIFKWPGLTLIIIPKSRHLILKHFLILQFLIKSIQFLQILLLMALLILYGKILVVTSFLRYLISIRIYAKRILIVLDVRH